MSARFEPTTGRTGILLAVFGSGAAQNENALRAAEDSARTRFPGLAVRLAFTSPLMRERLAGQWKKTDSVEKALRKMAFERFSRVVVQPLQLVPGVEYHEVLEEVAQVKGLFTALETGCPLLDENADLTQVVMALLHGIPEQRHPLEPVLFMGHGSRHPSESRYTALSETMQSVDNRVFLGTMKGGVRLEHLLDQVHLCRESSKIATGSHRVWLMPLLVAVGRHALEDMAGNGPDSWKSRLIAEGYEPMPILQGLLESTACLDLWMDRLRSALDRLQGDQKQPESRTNPA